MSMGSLPWEVTIQLTPVSQWLDVESSPLEIKEGLHFDANF
jgi:hypothetical protein